MAEPIKIFLIDDDKFLLDMYSLKFSRAGFSVETAANGMDALKRLRDGYSPNVILLDIIMPTVDGIEVLETISKEKLSPQSIVIMLSNQADDADKAKQLGAKGFIVKAVNIPSDVVKQVIEIYNKESK